MKNKLRQVISCDLDGTLCKEVCWTEEDCLKATPVTKVIAWFNFQYDECITIIYTARKDALMIATIKWLRLNGIRYWGINNQKMPADIYIDDKCLHPDKLE